MRSVQIALISYSPEVHCQVKNAVFGAASHLNAAGFAVSVTERIGDCMIPRARNAVVSDFLSGTEDDLIMIDADNYCQPGGFEKLLAANADVIGAPCRGKKQEVTWPIRWLHQNIEIKDGLMEVEHVGTGIIRMTRHCLQTMADHFPWYVDETAKSGRAPQLFWYEIVDDALWGEDLIFCKRWRDLGGKVFILADVTTWHIGLTAFQGSVTEWLKTVPSEMLMEDKATREALFVANPRSELPERKWPRPRTVTLALPTRGRPELLDRTVRGLAANSRLASTVICVGIDLDDRRHHPLPAGVRLAEEAREDSLGAKWNRCCKPEADVYVIGVDDVIFGPSWDVSLISAASQFEDNIGIIAFADRPDVLQTGLAVTGRLYDLMGGFPEDYPVWWVDTWLVELGRLIGRVARAGISAQVLNEHKGNSRGVRDVAFWAELFYLTRPERVALAKLILRASDNKPELNSALIAAMPALCVEFEQTHDCLRDPNKARETEAHYSFDAPDDERYRRIKARAEQRIAELTRYAA